MKNINLYITLIVLCIAVGCKHNENEHEHQHGSDETTAIENEHHEHGEELTLTNEQLSILGIKVDTVSHKNMNGFVQVSGELGVAPQNKAVVTTILGSNINQIKVVEGQKVNKGQILAYVSHPDIITLQTDYLNTYNNLKFLEQDYHRQKKLYDAEVGSGRDYQQAKSKFSSTQGLAKGYESQLRLLGLSPQRVRNGEISQVAPIRSSISGFIEKVEIKTGQYVEPQTPLFEIVNTDYLHADLMVFEKDINKIEKGQTVELNIEALANKKMKAKIFSVGKSFEEGPKALHIHAEIENKENDLMPGMYVNARIVTNDSLEPVLPEDAVIQEGNSYFAFIGERENDETWSFVPKEIIVKSTSDGYVAFDFLEKQNPDVLIAQSGAYYLMAEMKKSETEHTH